MDSKYVASLVLCLALAAWTSAAPETNNIPDWITYELENGTLVNVSFVDCPNTCDSVPLVDDITFLHYLSNSLYTEHVKLEPGNNFTGFETLNSSIPTVLVSHGFLSSPRSEIGQLIRNASADLYTMTKLAYNLVFIDWEKLANPSCWQIICYSKAKGNLPRVGEETATLINTMIRLNKTTWDKIIYVGHSLGSHIPNFIKPYLQNGTLPILHALDPAGVSFGNEADDKKLDPSDADFVSVIHSDSRLFGTDDPRGHADFYPTGGYSQPACWMTHGDVTSCSHSRAYHFFAESISNSAAFPSFVCQSWEEFREGQCNQNAVNYMGWNSRHPRGIFVKHFLEVNYNSPFSKELDNTTTSTTELANTNSTETTSTTLNTTTTPILTSPTDASTPNSTGQVPTDEPSSQPAVIRPANLALLLRAVFFLIIMKFLY